MRGLWDRETVALLLLVALLPVALFWLWHGGTAAALRLMAVLTVSGLWHLIFMLMRAQPPSLAGAAAALAVAMLAPQVGPVALVLGISFGTVMAELVFGGWGRNVLHPATITLAFLGFGFSAAPWPDLALPVAWAAIPAGILGAVLGVMPGRLLAGAALTWLAAGALGLPLAPLLPAAGLALVLLAADPVTSAATRAGAWLNGALYGGLVVLFAVHWPQGAPVQVAVSAALLASLTAPLLDEFAIAVWLTRRRKRHG